MLMLSRFGPIVSQHQTVRMFVMIISAGYRNDYDHYGPMVLFVLRTCIDSYSTLFFASMTVRLCCPQYLQFMLLLR